MNTASCNVHPEVQLEPKKKGWYCEECDRTVVGFEQVPRPGEANTAQVTNEATEAGLPLSVLVLDRFPFPVAYGYRKVIESESASHTVECVFYTYTATLRMTTLIFLSQFLGGDQQIPEAARALQQLRNPSLESWRTAMTKLAKHVFPPIPGPELRFAPFDQGGPLVPELVAAARRLGGLKRAGRSVHEQLRNARNERAHGTPWDETECRRRLPELRLLLDDALALFSALADVELLRRSPGGFVRLVGAQGEFPVETLVEPHLADLFEESACLVRGPAGDALPLFPLFLGEETVPQGYSEPLLVFDGHGKTSAVYLGVRSRTERQDTLSKYLDLLRAKDVDPRFTKDDMAPWSVAEWAREASLATVDALRGVKYHPEFYQERRATHRTDLDADAEGTSKALGVDDETERWLASGREAALVIAAEAGAGKTSLLCHLTETLLAPLAGGEPSPDCVLLLPATAVRGSGKLFDRIREGLGFSEDPKRGGILRFDELLEAWHRVGQASDVEYEKRRLVLLVDAVNEAEDPKALFEELSNLAVMAAAANRNTGRPWVRLLATVRAERIETLLERWRERSDTPFLRHAENFTHFEDERGRRVPYLQLRRFTAGEAEAAYRAAERLVPSCPADWATLALATQELLRHPLMVLLFHQAFADVERPPAVKAVDAIWGRWLSRTFDSAHGGERLEQRALDLADECINNGYHQIPGEMVAEWRTRWQAEQGNDPIRIASGMDDLERLAEAGLIRAIESGAAWDWVSDSLAEQLFFRALHRRDPEVSEESLAFWLQLLETPRLDGALVHAGTEAWKGQGFFAFRPFLVVGDGRSKRIFADAIAALAPRGRTDEIELLAGRFGEQLGELATWCITTGGKRYIEGFYHVLARGTWSALEDREGTIPASKAVIRQAIRLNEKLVALEPDDVEVLRGLSTSFDRLGVLCENTDPTVSREWYLKALDISQRLAVLEPDNTVYQIYLSISFARMGDIDGRTAPALSREWYLKALEVMQRLATQDPDNTGNLSDLSVLFERMGNLDGRRDPALARKWYLKALEIRQRLASLEPDNTLYLHNLSGSFTKLGRLDERADPTQVREWFLKALEINQRLAALKMDNPTYLRDLSISFGLMGSLEERTNLTHAREWYVKALEIVQRLTTLAPDNREFMRDLWVTLYQIGCLDEHTEPALAREQHLKALEICQRLATLEPENMLFLHDLSVLFNRMGNLDERTNPSLAREWYLKDLEIAQRLATLEPDNITFRLSLSISQVIQGKLALQLDINAAGAWFDHAIMIQRKLVSEQPRDAGLRERLAYVCHQRGAWARRQGRTDEHAAYRDECIQAIDRAEVLALPTSSTNFLRACAYAADGDSEMSLTALARAVELGFNDTDEIDEALKECHLEALRTDPRFLDLVEQIRRNRERLLPTG